MYTTKEKVRAELKGVDSVLVPDTSEDGFSLETAITKASAIVDAYLGASWSVPEPTPEIVASACTDLATGLVLEWLYSEGTEGYPPIYESRIKRAKDLLEKMADGRIEAGLTSRSSSTGGVWVA